MKIKIERPILKFSCFGTKWNFFFSFCEMKELNVSAFNSQQININENVYDDDQTNQLRKNNWKSLQNAHSQTIW